MRTLPVIPLIALWIITGVGCATQQVAERTNLPFSVAVLPVETAIRNSPDQEARQTPLEIELSLPGDEVSRAVVDRFARDGFTRAVLLSYPEGVDRETFLGWPEDKQSQWWIEAARKAHADLLLECRLSYSPRIHTERNDKFWPNFVLFSIGGPFNMFTDDRSYLVETDLKASLFDLNPIYSERSALFDRRSLLVALQSEYKEVALDFIDRAEGAGDYALGLIIPASFLAKENQTVRGKVESEVIQGLCVDLTQRLASEAEDVVTAERLVNFFLDPDTMKVTRTGTGEVHVIGDLILLKGGDAEALDEFRLQAGEASVEGVFGEGRLDEERSGRRQRYFRFGLDQKIAVDPSVERIRLTVWDDSRDRNSRSFTFPVAGPTP